MENMQTKIEPLNRLLRGELSAVETYNQALDKVAEGSTSQELRRISEEHNQAVNLLRDQIRELGGIPDESSGAWGVWAKTIEGAAKMFGESAALKALKEGEEHGLKEYNSVLEDPELPSQYRSLLTNRLKVRQAEHIATLDRCLNVLH